MVKSDTQAQFDHLLYSVLWPEFRKRGYKKRGANFWHYDVVGWGKIVNVQRSASSTKSDIRFTMNTGLYLREAELYLMGRASEEKFLEPDCLVRKRVGTLADTNSDLWYNLGPQTIWNELEAAVSQSMQLLVLPYLDSIGSIEDILHQLFRERGPDVFAGIRALFIYGRKAEARQWLAEELKETTYVYRKKKLLGLSNELDSIQ